MANAFDQFERGGNPFDKFDDPFRPEDILLKKGVRAAGAGASGVNRGVLRMFGIPADTVANVIDLLKAGAGWTYGGVTGKTPPESLDPMNRSEMPLTGDWLEKQLAKVGGGDIINAGAREFPTTHAFGMGVGSSLVPVKGGNIPRAVAANAAAGGAATATGSVVGDVTGSQNAAILASLLVPASRMAVEGGVRKALGGDPAETRARIKAFKDAGVDEPSVGLATGNRLSAGIENLLSNTPGSMDIIANARQKMIAGMQGKTEATRNLASSTYNPTATGNAIQRGGEAFDESMIAGRRNLYDILDTKIPKLAPTPVAETQKTLAALNADIPGAPNLSRQFKNSRIVAIEEALNNDLLAGGTPPQRATPPQMSMVVGPDGKPIMLAPGTPAIPGQPTTTLPWQAPKQLRTLVGQEISDTNMASTVPRSKWNPFYGALSRDMEQAAVAAGPEAIGAFKRATNYTRAGAERSKLIEPIVKANTPEQAWASTENLGKGGVTMFQALKKSLPPGTRGAIAATKIDRMGRANPGAQNSEGDVWSPETFLTNYNKMPPKARSEFFSGFPNAPQVQKDLDAVAKAASMLRDSSKTWANPSGTGGNLAARGALGAIGTSALILPFSPSAAAALALPVAGTMLGANAAARLMVNQKFVGWLAQSTKLPDERMLSQLNRLSVMANDSGDKQFMEDVAAYLESLNQ